MKKIYFYEAVVVWLRHIWQVIAAWFDVLCILRRCFVEYTLAIESEI